MHRNLKVQGIIGIEFNKLFSQPGGDHSCFQLYIANMFQFSQFFCMEIYGVAHFIGANQQPAIINF